MKTIRYTSLMLLLFAVVLSGCRKAAQYEDAIYFTGTEQSPETRFTIDGPSALGITVSSSNKVTKDVAVKIRIDSALVSSYNKSRGTTYQFLPQGSYDLPSTSVVIKE